MNSSAGGPALKLAPPPSGVQVILTAKRSTIRPAPPTLTVTSPVPPGTVTGPVQVPAATAKRCRGRTSQVIRVVGQPQCFGTRGETPIESTARRGEMRRPSSCTNVVPGGPPGL